VTIAALLIIYIYTVLSPGAVPHAGDRPEARRNFAQESELLKLSPNDRFVANFGISLSRVRTIFA